MGLEVSPSHGFRSNHHSRLLYLTVKPLLQNILSLMKPNNWFWKINQSENKVVGVDLTLFFTKSKLSHGLLIEACWWLVGQNDYLGICIIMLWLLRYSSKFVMKIILVVQKKVFILKDFGIFVSCHRSCDDMTSEFNSH